MDIKLPGEMVFPIADMLRARSAPFLFATGHEPTVIPPGLDDVRRCAKPTAFRDISRTVAEIIG
ncbi:MAG: hypothetical protein J7530_21595 [Novosphingobium sp.]|nr:hypothetical protein [Novosphingobium sp.]